MHAPEFLFGQILYNHPALKLQCSFAACTIKYFMKQVNCVNLSLSSSQDSLYLPLFLQSIKGSGNGAKGEMHAGEKSHLHAEHETEA